MSLTGWRAYVVALTGLLVFAAISAPAADLSARQPETIAGIGRDLVAIKAPCRFHTGDDPTWASPSTDDSSWEEVDIGKPLGSQGHWSFTGYGWYRCHLNIPPVPAVTQKLAILLPPTPGPYQAFWNSSSIGSVGSMPPWPRYVFRGVSNSFWMGGGAGVLAIRYWSPPYEFGERGDRAGFYSSPLIGTDVAVAAKLGEMDHVWLRDKQVYYTVNIIYTLLGVLAFIAWLLNRRRKLLLWVALYAFTLPAHVLLFNAHMPIRTQLAMGFDDLASACREVALWYLLIYVLELDQHAVLRRWTRRIAAVTITSGIVLLLVINLDWSAPYVLVYQYVEAIFAVIIGLYQGFAIVIVLFAIGKRLPLAAWLVGISALVLELIGVIAVTSIQSRRFTHWHSVYDVMRYNFFSLNGNYFDPQNIMTIVLLASILFAVYRYSIDQAAHSGHLEQELKSAQEVQRILIPETLASPPGFSVTSAYQPAQEVGGDFFQVIAQQDGSALIVVGDVSGKGLKAAMNVSLIIGTIRAIADTPVRPAALLDRLNRRLHGRLQDGFATCVVARLTPQGECTVANAGHLSPFVNDREIELPGSLPLGLVPVLEFEETSFHLDAKESLMFYTDGLLEARAPGGELYGFDRVRHLMSTHPDAQTALNAAVTFGQDDDITVLSVTRLATA